MNCVQVLYFAGLVDVTKINSEQVEIDPVASVQDVIDVLEKKYGPEFTKIVDTCMFAVDMDYVPRSHPLHSRQELAIIPPVSGG